MEEPPITYDYLAEPDAELLNGSEIDPFADAEIENRVAAVEMRDAQNFSARTTGTGAKRRSRRSNSKSAKRKPGKRSSSSRTSDNDGDDDSDDDGDGSTSLLRNGRFGSLRAGLVLTVISVIGCMFIFIINSGPKLTPTNVSITPPVINSNYTGLVPPPPSKPTPRVKPTRLHLVK